MLNCILCATGVRSNQIIIITFYRHSHYNLCVGSTVRGRRGGVMYHHYPCVCTKKENLFLQVSCRCRIQIVIDVHVVLMFIQSSLLLTNGNCSLLLQREVFFGCKDLQLQHINSPFSCTSPITTGQTLGHTCVGFSAVQCTCSYHLKLYTSLLASYITIPQHVEAFY